MQRLRLGTPYNYVVCCPAWTARLAGLQDRFWADWRAPRPAAPDPEPLPRVCTDYVAINRLSVLVSGFGVLSVSSIQRLMTTIRLTMEYPTYHDGLLPGRPRGLSGAVQADEHAGLQPGRELARGAGARGGHNTTPRDL